MRFLPLLLLLAIQSAQSRPWAEEKCLRYREAWAGAVQLRGTAGLSAEFLAAHDAFLASGCRERAACPRNPNDIAMADLMAVAGVNAGISGTFLPFRCNP